MSDYDNTNTAIAFVDNGLFNKAGVEAKGSKPILTVKVNFDGVDKEIGLWFSTDKQTGQYKVTQNGSKMLTGQVKDPYVAQAVQAVSATVNDEFEDDIPF